MSNNDLTITVDDWMNQRLEDQITFELQEDLHVIRETELREENESLRRELDVVKQQLFQKEWLLDITEDRVNELSDQVETLEYEKAEVEAKLRNLKRKRELEGWLQQTMEEYQEIEKQAADAWLEDDDEMRRIKRRALGFDE